MAQEDVNEKLMHAFPNEIINEDTQQIKMKTMHAPTLIRTTKSICLVCYRIIDAKLYEENGAVYMGKSCAEHGTFKDLCWSNYQPYKQFEAKDIEEAVETLLSVRAQSKNIVIYHRGERRVRRGTV